MGSGRGCLADGNGPEVRTGGLAPSGARGGNAAAGAPAAASSVTSTRVKLFSMPRGPYSSTESTSLVNNRKVDSKRSL